ncbi:MAG: hypothetical protein LUG21_07455 [Clostridiales bacterium]|nr:hypothetical protein [Clostridiales bacterium]
MEERKISNLEHYKRDIIEILDNCGKSELQAEALNTMFRICDNENIERDFLDRFIRFMLDDYIDNFELTDLEIETLKYAKEKGYTEIFRLEHDNNIELCFFANDQEKMDIPFTDLFTFIMNGETTMIDYILEKCKPSKQTLRD